MASKKYPIEEGWITAKLQLSEPGEILDRDQVIKFLMGGHPEDYELAEYRNFKTLVRVIFRRKKIRCMLCGSTDRESLVKSNDSGYFCHPDCKEIEE